MAKNIFTSDRILLNDQPDRIELVIHSGISRWQFIALTGWLIAWTVAGIYVISQFFMAIGQEMRLFMMIWLVFWFYFEYRIGKAFLWRLSGKEIIRFTPEKSELRFETKYSGTKAWEFNTEEIRNVTNLEADKGLFVKNYQSSFWVVGGETIGFYCRGKLYAFGRQLPVEDAVKLTGLISHRLDRWNKTGN